jgi:hypothetical protein
VLPENDPDLGCHLAASLGDVAPVVAQGDDAHSGQGVVTVDITPPVLDQMCSSPIELNGYAKLPVMVVQVAVMATDCDSRLSACDR